MSLSLSLTGNMSLTGNRDPLSTYALALDFENANYWVGGTKYAPLSAVPGYAFTRTGEQGAVDSDGTVDWFTANTPAINGNGYHTYGALTNNSTYSQQINSWAKTNCTVTADAVTAPDGTMTMDTIVEDAATTFKFVQLPSAITTVGSTVYTRSVLAKAGTLGLLQLTDNQGSRYCNFNLTNGTVGSSSGITGYIISLGGGLYRCVVVFTTGAGETVFNPYLMLINSITDVRAPSYLGSNRTVHVWQHQVIPGNFPDGGPLIRTTTAAASIGASSLAVSLANGTYSATYTFDDDTTQNNPALVIADGALNLPADFAPNRNIIKQLLIP